MSRPCRRANASVYLPTEYSIGLAVDRLVSLLRVHPALHGCSAPLLIVQRESCTLLRSSILFSPENAPTPQQPFLVELFSCALHITTRSGCGRVRTDDIRLAKPMLSQLSYAPENCWWGLASRLAIVALLAPRAAEPPFAIRRFSAVSVR